MASWITVALTWGWPDQSKSRAAVWKRWSKSVWNQSELLEHKLDHVTPLLSFGQCPKSTLPLYLPLFFLLWPSFKHTHAHPKTALLHITMSPLPHASQHFSLSTILLSFYLIIFLVYCLSLSLNIHDFHGDRDFYKHLINVYWTKAWKWLPCL